MRHIYGCRECVPAPFSALLAYIVYAMMLDRPPQVSVIIPSYNAAEYIVEAVKSVADQTFRDWELLVVDDGSSDDTAELVKPFLSDPRIRFFHKPNGGAASARNYGIARAHADLIAFLDADDYWLPTKLEKQVAALARFPDVGICGTGRTHVSPTGETLREFVNVGFHGEAFPRLLFAPLADMSMGVVRRCVFDSVGLFDETLRYSEDYEFWLRAGQSFTFHIIPESLVCIRIGYPSTSGSWTARREYFHTYILPRWLDQHNGRRFVKPWHLWRLRARHYKYLGDESTTCYTKVSRYVQSACMNPLDIETYSAIGATVMPASLWQLAKRLWLSNKR